MLLSKLFYLNYFRIIKRNDWCIMQKISEIVPSVTKQKFSNHGNTYELKNTSNLIRLIDITLKYMIFKSQTYYMFIIRSNLKYFSMWLYFTIDF